MDNRRARAMLDFDYIWSFFFRLCFIINHDLVIFVVVHIRIILHLQNTFGHRGTQVFSIEF